MPIIIDVPNTDPGAYNPNRPAGKLLMAQAHHLRDALIKNAAEAVDLIRTDMTSLKTEQHVSEFVRKATAILHRYRPPSPARPHR